MVIGVAIIAGATLGAWHGDDKPAGVAGRHLLDVRSMRRNGFAVLRRGEKEKPKQMPQIVELVALVALAAGTL